MMHTPVQHWVETQPTKEESPFFKYKSFDEWMASPYFEWVGRTVTRREWWTDTEINTAEMAWKAARE